MPEKTIMELDALKITFYKEFENENPNLFIESPSKFFIEQRKYVERKIRDNNGN